MDSGIALRMLICWYNLTLKTLTLKVYQLEP